MKVTFVIFGFITAIAAFDIYNTRVYAQVIPDSTLKTTVQGTGNYTITDGSRVGNNLFHSFKEFSIPNHGSVFFDHANDIQNIFSRVTGGSISRIDGLIQSNSKANVFLLNPNGIIFGENARLSIGGSFVGTTANSIRFADGTEFSAINASNPPLLTVSVPIGLQMGQNSGAITVYGLGHPMQDELFFPQDRSNNPNGLEIKAGNTLALIGNQVNFAGGTVAVTGGGHLEIGSVRQGQVELHPTVTGWKGNYSQVEQFNDIHLAQQSLLDASGSNGSIQLQGQNINLTEGSYVLIQNLNTRSQGINIYATDSLYLAGYTSEQKSGSVIKIENLGTDSPGDIFVSAANLSLQDGGKIWTKTFTTAASGNITIKVQDSIDINGFTPINPNLLTLIGTTTLNSGNAGDVTVSSGNIKIVDGGNITSGVLSSGQSGSLLINADNLIEVVGLNPLTLSPSTIGLVTFSTGNTTSVVVNTSKLILREGGALGANTLNQGSSGSVIVNASDFIEVSGQAPGSITSSRIASTSAFVDPVLQALYGVSSIPNGDAGYLTINTPLLLVTDSALVSVKNDGPGKAGDLQVNAKAIFLNNQGNITASTASGNGGNINLNLQDYLLMRQGSWVSATSVGTGNGGNLSIHSPVIVGLENSNIIANAVQGRGGNIDITTQAIFGIKYRPQLTNESDITASSQFGINGTVDINNFGVDPNSGLVQLPVNITELSQQIATGCADTTGSSFIATGRGGVPQNPLQQVRSDRTWSDIRDLAAYRKTESVKAQIPSPPKVPLQATSWYRNSQGKIELVAVKSSMSGQPSFTCGFIPKS
ncbi:beta strand repeat-containing protein [Nostoc sp. CMAA1605]|uniref:beta strand repeat-containing protein n=1 Tax=Nostoc sp. CMAA1605 TaxID=2055159 RepID=UPI001F3D0D98|nr:S-layer family protein [Nostoc sp. CMAA1605]MCF4967037.1 filamentous hemagglutinin [Nostoc sp. CMAA1605]